MKLLKLANPIAVTKGAFGVAGTALGLVDTMARGTAHLALRGLQRLGDSDEPSAESPAYDGADATDVAARARAVAPEAAVADMDEPSTAPAPLPVEPPPPVQPPIDVVGQA